MREILLVFLVFLLLFASFKLLPPPDAPPWPELVRGLTVSRAALVEVRPGPILEVIWLDPGERPTRVRPYLVEAPPPGACGFEEALAAARDALFGRELWIVHRGRIAEGEALWAFVFLDAPLFELWQARWIEAGHARLRVSFPEEEAFRTALEALQAQAQAARRGRWGACPA